MNMWNRLRERTTELCYFILFFFNFGRSYVRIYCLSFDVYTPNDLYSLFDIRLFSTIISKTVCGYIWLIFFFFMFNGYLELLYYDRNFIRHDIYVQSWHFKAIFIIFIQFLRNSRISLIIWTMTLNLKLNLA